MFVTAWCNHQLGGLGCKVRVWDQRVEQGLRALFLLSGVHTLSSFSLGYRNVHVSSRIHAAGIEVPGSVVCWVVASCRCDPLATASYLPAYSVRALVHDRFACSVW